MKISIIFPVALTLTALVFSLTSSACSVRSNSIVTFYGYPDNSPPGAATAYDCGGRNYIAGGTGTYSNPLTFASAQGEYNECEIIYLPYLEWYLRYEDDCEQCTTDWSSGISHIDVWTGSSTVNGGQTQLNCEDSLTPDAHQSIVRQPSSSLTVNSAALFSNGNCDTSATYPNNNPQAFCGSGGSPSPPPPAGSCAWPGHCAGASCGNDNDCSGALTCQNGHCA